MTDRIDGIIERMEVLEEKVNRVIDAAIEKDEESLREGPIEQLTIMDIDKRVKAIAPTMDTAKTAIAEEVGKATVEFVTKEEMQDAVTKGEVEEMIAKAIAPILAPTTKPAKKKVIRKPPKL